MPISSENDNFTAYHFYVDKDFKVILKAFDILVSHNSNLDEWGLTELQKKNGLRSFFIRKFMEKYVSKNKDVPNVLTPEMKRQIDEYFRSE